MADANFQVKKGLTVGTDKLVVGNEIGINTTDAQSTLDVRASGVVTYLNVGSETADGAYLTLDGNSNGDGLGSDYGRIAHTSSGVLQINNLQPESLELYTNNERRTFINGSGYILIGGEQARNGLNFGAPSNYTEDFQIQLETAGNNSTRGLAIIHHAGIASASVRGPQINLARSSSTAVGGSGIVGNNYELGEIAFYGADGVNFKKAASITAAVDGTPSTGDVPGALNFSTAPSGAADPEIGLRLLQNSRVHIGSDYSGTNAQLHVRVPNSDTITEVLRLEQLNAAETDGCRLSLTADAANDEVTYEATGTNAAEHIFKSGNTETVRFRTDGNIQLSSGQGERVGILPSNGITVTTVATTIVNSAGSVGTLNVVNGSSGSDRFCDLVMASTAASPVVVTSFTAFGSPAARTYSRSGPALQLAMASDSYVINTLTIGNF